MCTDTADKQRHYYALYWYHSIGTWRDDYPDADVAVFDTGAERSAYVNADPLRTATDAATALRLMRAVINANRELAQLPYDESIGNYDAADIIELYERVCRRLDGDWEA